MAGLWNNNAQILNIIRDVFLAKYKALIEMAKIVEASAYNVDKMFWLIGSGYYYLHNISIGSNKEKFINKVQKIQI